MANALYDKGRQSFLEVGGWLTDTIGVMLVDLGAYTPNLATDQFLSDIPLAARIASTTLGGKTSTNGVGDGADVTYPALGPTVSCEAAVLYRDTGVPGTSRLLAYIDSAIGLPVTPLGGDVEISWDNGPNKIFRL